PMSRRASRVLEPMARRPGKIDHNKVRPAVPVHVLGPASEAMAIAVGAIAVIARRRNLVRLPIRRFVPEFPGQDIRLAVAVDIRHCYAFGAKGLVDNGLLPGNGARRSVLWKSGCKSDERGKRDTNNQNINISGSNGDRS